MVSLIEAVFELSSEDSWGTYDTGRTKIQKRAGRAGSHRSPMLNGPIYHSKEALREAKVDERGQPLVILE
jgi:hypothetical protein